MRTALLDSDILAYEFASKSERKYPWDEGVESRIADPIEDVQTRLAAKVESLRKEVKADAVIVCLSDQARNFRKDVLPTYKGNRAGVIKPEHLFPLKDWLATSYRSFIRPGLEADDVMGILATHPTLVKGEKVIVSEDKDMGQIPGLWFNPNKGMRRVTPEEGERLHWMQMLTGDTVDGYKGIPGVGPKKAAAILTAPNSEAYGAWSCWQAVLAAYEARGYTEADALAQARVSKILQWTDYDYKRKEPILWNPPA